MNIWLSTAVFGLAAALTVNQGVVGSSPTSGASESITYAANQDVAFLKKQDVSKKTTLESNQLTARALHTETQLPSESLDDFLTRVGLFLHSWTKEHKVEACGMITKTGDTHSVIIGTSDSEIMCDSIFIAKGSVSTGETIHSHPRGDSLNRIFISDRSRQLAQGALDNVKVVTAQPRTFSHGDLATGHGYLVTDGFLMYQNGKGTEKTIKKLPL